MFSFPILLWPMTPDVFLARWWWTIILSRQASASRAASSSASGARENTVPTAEQSGTAAYARKSK